MDWDSLGNWNLDKGLSIIARNNFRTFTWGRLPLIILKPIWATKNCGKNLRSPKKQKRKPIRKRGENTNKFKSSKLICLEK